MTCCEICAISAYQNEHLEAFTARYDFTPYITQTRGHRNKSAVCTRKHSLLLINKDICTESVAVMNAFVSIQELSACNSASAFVL